MIELKNVTKLYGSVIGVNDITLTLEPGVYGLLGPNGSGKTTLLNLITGQLRPTLGSLRVFGESPWNRHRLFRRLGLCPAQEIFYADVTARDWVQYLLRLSGYDRAAAGRRATKTLEQVGLGPAMHRKMGEYSRGMRQRAKLAQAMAHEPDLLILDEPFNGLDPIGRHEMTELLRDWTAGRSLILASHLLYEVEALSDSFLLILGGRLLAAGRADEVHYLLAGAPCQIEIRCADPRRMAQVLLAREAAESVQLLEANRLSITTRQPAHLAQQLPLWCLQEDLLIDEIHAPDDSLQALFHAIVRRHRGEMP
jgi:ABC-2 type transport system ATP-binding protein